jgi:Caspase domain
MAKKVAVAASAQEFDGQVFAVIVGIENYQEDEKGKPALPKVDFARQDAEGFAQALKSIYPEDKLDISLLIDSQATSSSLDYVLKQTIEALSENDLFIFYYAGHGFHGAGGNRVTAWDSRPFNIEGSTLLLREKVSDRAAA